MLKSLKFLIENLDDSEKNNVEYGIYLRKDLLR